MKKTLLICLLGLLCLPVSTTTAQVADSPPETDLVDYSGLPAEDRTAYISVLDEEVGLLAGNRIADFSVNDLKVGFPGQEGESSSAQLGKEAIPQSAVIWGMVSDYSGMDEVELRVFSDFFFNSPKAPLSNNLSIPLKKGSLMEGGYPKDKSFQYQLDGISKPAWISLSQKNFLPFLQGFVIEPGDSVQVFADLQRLFVVFAGPDADKFRLQYQLQTLRSEELRADDPILWTGKPDAVLSDSSFLLQYLEALESAGPVLQIRDRNSEQLSFLESFDPYAQNGLLAKEHLAIESYRGSLDDTFLDLLRTESELKEWIKHLAGIYSTLIYATMEGKVELEAGLKSLTAIRLAEFKSSVEGKVSPHSSAMMDFLDVQTKLLVASKGIGYRQAIGEIAPGYWREKYVVRLLYDKYQGLKETEEILEEELQDMENPQYKQMLSTLKDLTGVGEPVRGFEFTGNSGEPIGFDQLPDAEIYLVEFWITGCKVCVAFNELTLSKLSARFGEDQRLQVITISADFEEEVWKKSLASGRYTQPGFTNLYTGSINRKHPFLLKYGISSFPNRILLDREGRILQISQVPFAAELLIPLLENYLTDSAPVGSQP